MVIAHGIYLSLKGVPNLYQILCPLDFERVTVDFGRKDLMIGVGVDWTVSYLLDFGFLRLGKRESVSIVLGKKRKMMFFLINFSKKG